MKLISFTRGLLDNIGVKLIALVVAMVIWFNASGQQEIKRDYQAALKFVNVPDTLMVTGRVPTDVELSVSGTRRQLLFLGFRKMSVRVNLARATPGRFSQRLAVSDVELPAGIEPGDVRITSPLAVDINLERVISKRMRVSVILSGSLPNNFMLSRVPEAKPAWVVVTGPESAVTPLEKLPTKSIDLTKIRESAERDVALDYDSRTLQCEPDHVVVSVLVSTRGSRVLANVPPTVLIDDKKLSAEVFPKTVTLTLEGPQALLDTLSSGDVSILVDLSGKPPGRYSLAPEIIVPNGVERYVMDVDSLHIVVSKPPEPGSG
jgi:YbbR domain-containing protein